MTKTFYVYKHKPNLKAKQEEINSNDEEQYPSRNSTLDYILKTLKHVIKTPNLSSSTEFLLQ